MRREHPIDTKYGQDLKASRQNLGLTQNDIALKLGVCESTVAKIETGRVPVSPQRRDAIEQILHSAEQARELAAV